MLPRGVVGPLRRGRELRRQELRTFDGLPTVRRSRNAGRSLSIGGRTDSGARAHDALGLPHAAGQAAERYIRMTPRQVDTPYRRHFEAEFGWTPIGEV